MRRIVGLAMKRRIEERVVSKNGRTRNSPLTSCISRQSVQCGVFRLGSQACIRCHTARHASYLLTSHSRTFRETDAQSEPDDAKFKHSASARHYEVHRKNGMLYHQETLVGTEQKVLAVTDLPVKYAVGSGAHASTYLCESDGRLLESPVSWFRDHGWAMSPGYDRADHPSFTRVHDLPQAEQDRREMLAVYYALHTETDGNRFRDQARWSLGAMYQQVRSDQADRPTIAALARNVMMLGDAKLAQQLAERLLRESKRGSRESIEARDILAEIALHHQDNAVALEHFRELTSVRHLANDYFLLGLCEQNAGNTESAIDAFRRALAIQPDLMMGHRSLAALFRRLKRPEAEIHEAVIPELGRLQQTSSDSFR